MWRQRDVYAVYGDSLVIFHHKRYDRCRRDRCPARIRLLHQAGRVTRGGLCRPPSSQGGALKPTDERRAENEALRDRLSRLSESSLRICESLDVNTVLREVVESAPRADQRRLQRDHDHGRRRDTCRISSLPA